MTTFRPDHATEAFCQRCRELRYRHRLTQEEVAEGSGMGVKNYQKIEAGKKNVYLHTVERLADFYRIDLSSLVAEAFPEDASPSRVASSAVHTASPRDSYGRGKRPRKTPAWVPVEHHFSYET